MKTAYVSVTYLFQLEPAEVGISDESSKKEFEAAIDGYMNRVFEEIYRCAHIVPNNIEAEVTGF